MGSSRFLQFIVFGLLLLSAACGSSYEAASAPMPYHGGQPGPRTASEDSGGGDGDGIVDEMAYGVAMSDDVVATSGSISSETGLQAPKAPPAPPSGNRNAKQPAEAAPKKESPAQAKTQASDPRSPILIYRADFTMSVYEVKKSLDEIEALARRVSGYLSRREDMSITIRIPASEFQAVVAELEKMGDVLNRNVVSEDVTAEYRDLEVQLMNLQALRNRFEKLLEKAQKVEEALQIERELGRITGEIERIKGRLKLLNDLAQYSTITVRFQPKVTQNVGGGPFVIPLPWLNNLGLPGLLAL
jgi:hypothetical protein